MGRRLRDQMKNEEAHRIEGLVRELSEESQRGL